MPERGYNFTPFLDGVAVDGADINAQLDAFSAAVAAGAVGSDRLDRSFRLPSRYCLAPKSVHFYTWTLYNPQLINTEPGYLYLLQEYESPGPLTFLGWNVGLRGGGSGTGVGSFYLDLVDENGSPLAVGADPIQAVAVTNAHGPFQWSRVQTQAIHQAVRVAEGQPFALRLLDLSAGATPLANYSGLSVAVSVIHRHVSVRD